MVDPRETHVAGCTPATSSARPTSDPRLTRFEKPSLATWNRKSPIIQFALFPIGLFLEDLLILSIGRSIDRSTRSQFPTRLNHVNVCFQRNGINLFIGGGNYFSL